MDAAFKLEITGNIDEKIDIVKKIGEHLESVKELGKLLSSEPITISTKEILLENL